MSASVPSWAVPGAKVVCVDDDWSGRRPRLKRNSIYTITEVRYHVCTNGKYAGNDDPVLVLRELYNDDSPSGGFNILRFRPLVTRSQEQDVAQFRKLLIGAPKGVDA